MAPQSLRPCAYQAATQVNRAAARQTALGMARFNAFCIIALVALSLAAGAEAKDGVRKLPQGASWHSAQSAGSWACAPPPPTPPARPPRLHPSAVPVTWTLGQVYKPLSVCVGDTVTFNWQGQHDLWLMKSFRHEGRHGV